MDNKNKKINLSKLFGELSDKGGFGQNAKSQHFNKERVQEKAVDKVFISKLKVKTNDKDKSLPIPPAELKRRLPLKDSIHFKSNLEYEAYLEKVLDEQGANWELYDRYKVLHTSGKNIRAMQKIWGKMEGLGMSELDIILEKAESYRQMERMDLAYESLDTAVRRYPNDPHANYAMSMYYKLLRDYELAIYWINNWKRLDPANPECYFHLGSIYRRTGSLDMARTQLLECVRIQPGHLGAASLLSKL